MEETKNKNVAFYKTVKTVEMVNGKPTEMYGVEGFSENEVVTIKALSCDKARISKLVATMNEVELELCHLKDVVDDFLYFYNKEKKNQCDELNTDTKDRQF